MCTQKAPKCWTHQLYERFEQSVSEYLSDTVLPAVRFASGVDGRILVSPSVSSQSIVSPRALFGLQLNRQDSGDAFIRELVHRWESHMVMRRWMGAFFAYLVRLFLFLFFRHVSARSD